MTEADGGLLGGSGGRRASQRHATDLALRRAAFTLFEANGYGATRTEQIARAAGVSPRTFFNYFPTKESVFLLPQQPLVELVGSLIALRPPAEDPATSVAAVAMDSLGGLAAQARGEERQLMLWSVRLMLRDPECRPIFLARRFLAEETAWEAVVARGTPADDIAARAAVAAVAALTFLALAIWAEADGQALLPEVLAQCFDGCPHPARLLPAATGRRPQAGTTA